MAKLDFSTRAQLEEQIDGPCAYEELRRCLCDLAVMNRITLAHRPTMLWLEKALSPVSRAVTGHTGPSRAIKLVDVGCGYGDMLRRIEQWARRRGLAMDLVGIDVNANAVRAAREASRASGVRYVLGDACVCADAQDADLIAASGMTHHLGETEIVRLLAWMEQTAGMGWLITDLHRMPVPYHVFSIAARGPWWQRFIRPDGLRSIQRRLPRSGLDADVPRGEDGGRDGRDPHALACAPVRRPQPNPRSCINRWRMNGDLSE